MKRSILFFVALVCLAATITSCEDTCQSTETYIYYEPVYQTSAEVKAAISVQPPHQLTDLGRIYFKDGYLFINERGKGIHIIDNRNPAAPVALSFLNIPGNFDLAIQGSILYADSYVDLVAFSIADLSDIREVKRLENLFNNYVSMGRAVSSESGILTGWREVESVAVNRNACEMQMQPWGGVLFEDGLVAFSSNSSVRTAVAPGPSSGAGVAGSMARFSLNDSFLYALDGANLDVVDVSLPASPVAKNEISVAWDVETIFPHDTKLFFGTQSGMLIYDLADRSNPAFISQYTHVRSCDPVVVEGDYAYVTLRSGTECQGFTNQLEVINISNPAQPVLEKTCLMTNPHGLGIDNGVLFICDGMSGLRIFDATDLSQICDASLAHYPNINAFDIIPYQSVAMMISNDGLYQYDYSNPKNVKLLSTLSIAP